MDTGKMPKGAAGFARRGTQPASALGAPFVDRGQLIYAMAVIDRQVDDIRRILALPRMQHMIPACKRLALVADNLVATQRTIYSAMGKKP